MAKRNIIFVIAAIILAAIVLISTIFLMLGKTSIDKTAEEVILTPADMPSGIPSNFPHGDWRSVSGQYGYSYSLPDVSDFKESGLSTNYSYEGGESNHASITIMVWHFNSSGSANSTYELFRSGGMGQVIWPISVTENISVGEKGFAKSYDWGNMTDNGTSIGWLMFTKGEYLVYMSFYGWAGYPPYWIDSEILEIAQIQADKISS